MTMLDVLDMLEQTSSTKEKERILKENESQELKDYLSIALDPFRVYHVKQLPTGKKEGKPYKVITREGFNGFKELIGLLERREVSGDIAANTIYDLFSEFTSTESRWFARALTKDAIGVGYKTVNKVYRNLIPEFGVMLADNEQPDIKAITYPVIVQPKLDGFRAVYIPGLGLIGRNGRKIRNEHLGTHFSRLHSVSDFVFDGELYGHGLGFNEIASVLNSEEKEIPEALKYYVYDGMTLSDWKVKGCKLGYSDRLREVGKHGFLNIVKGWTAENVSDVEKVFTRSIKDGYEGVMLKDPNGLYQWKRVRLSSQIMMKLKQQVTYDLVVEGVEAGSGKLANTLGNLIVNFKGVSVAVGTGFTEAERDNVWKNRTKIIGKLVEVKGMEVTEDGSIRHPVFVRFREDKE